MAKKIPFVTPIGVARYPHITSPDATGKFADNKFKTKLVVAKADAKAFIDNIKATAKALGVKKLPFADDPDDESNIVITAKSKYKPLVVDPKRKELKGDLSIGGGSKLRLAGFLFPYDTGVSLQLTQVQVIELVKGGGDVMFDEVEGAFSADDFGDDDEPTFGEVSDNELDI